MKVTTVDRSGMKFIESLSRENDNSNEKRPKEACSTRVRHNLAITSIYNGCTNIQFEQFRVRAIMGYARGLSDCYGGNAVGDHPNNCK